MRIPIFSLAAFSLIFCLQPTAAQAQFGGLLGGGPKVEIVSVDELRDLLAAKQKREEDAKKAGLEKPESNFVLVDVRTEEEVAVSLIPGAITKAEYEKNKAIYSKKTVIPYCTVGGRSGRFAKELAAAGTSVKNFEGSILGWVNASQPLVTLEGKPTKRVFLPSTRYSVPDGYEAVKK